MISLGRILAGALVAAGCSGAAGAVVSPPRFAVEVLPSFAGGETTATALNDVGQVTGSSGSHAAALGKHAFIWSEDGGLQRLDPGEVYRFSEGKAINNSGQVATLAVLDGGMYGQQRKLARFVPGDGLTAVADLVGEYGRIMDINESGAMTGYWTALTQSGYAARAFVYTDADGFQEIPPFDGVGSSIAWDINDLGQIVGTASSGASTRAFLYEGGALTDLGTLGGNSADAYYIDNQGVIVGWASTADGSRHAFRWTLTEGIQDLDSLGDSVASEALWNVDSGWVIGRYTHADGSKRQFYTLNDGPMVDMGVQLAGDLEGVHKINDAGQGIGTMLVPGTSTTHAVYFAPQVGVHDLNELVVDATAVAFHEGVDINEVGQVLVRGRVAGSGPVRSVLLTPLVDGDSNCDGAVDFDDIPLFVSAIGSEGPWRASYEALYGEGPDCHYLNSDVDRDGDVDFDDIGPFVDALGQ